MKKALLVIDMQNGLKNDFWWTKCIGDGNC